MEDDLIEVIESKHGLIEENGPRVEWLFCVHIDLKKTNGGSWSCEVSPQTSCTPEDLVKAKVYIHSLLGEGEGFMSLVIPFNPSLQKMILKTRDDIERQTAVIISPGEHDNGIKLYGPLNRVIDAKFVIKGLIRQHMIAVDSERELNNEDTTYLSTQSSQIPEQNSFDGDSSPRFPNVMKSNVDLEHFSQLDSDGEGFFGENSIDSYHDFGYPQIQKDMHYYGNLTSGDGDGEDSSSESSDDEEDGPEIQNNLDYPAKIEFALKLGYHETDLVRALKKLGLDASQNELLSELIKNGISKGDSCPRPDFDESLFHPSDNVEESTRESQSQTKDASDNLRHIIIDGSNIAMSHGNKETFSCHGIKVAVDWFRERGHKDITVFVPQWRKETSRSDSRIKDQTILSQLEKEKILVYTPARRIGGKRVICYDDRYILKLAVDTDGIVVSNDNYRDLLDEKEEFKKVIEERLLMYSFVNDRFMPPDDPLGRNGPTLEAFLQKESPLPKSLPPLCPYGSKKCTYGNKCKYYHPERRNTPQKSVTEKLAEQAKQRMLEVKERNADVKKPLARSSLCRTKSLNPGEIGRNPEHSRLTSTQSLSASPFTMNTQREETYQDFNQKLSENLRKMAKEKDSKETHHPKTPEKKVRKKNKETPNQSSPRWNFPLGGISPGGGSPRGTSPISSLIVPGHDMEFDDSEKFLSGHLLLAKKLSDEANESDKNKKSGKPLNESSSEPGHGTGVSFHFSEIPSSHKLEPKKLKQKAHQPLQKQALSRQLSLQGNEDPRLRQMHGALKPQYSYGGTSQHFANNMPDQSEIKSLMSDFMKGQNQSLVEKQGAYGDTEQPNMHQSSLPQHRTKPSLTRVLSEGFTPSFSQELPFSLGMPAHTPVTRMQSAPDPHALRHQQMRNQRRMTRQNSSSDTQLNKLDSLDEASIQMSGRQFYPDPFSEPVYGGGMERVTNRSAPVAFQFGGPQTDLSHSRSVGSNIQNIQQFSNPPNVQQFIGSRDVYPYPTNQQFNQHQYETPHPHQQHLPYRNVVGAGGPYGVPVQSGMTPYSGMSVSQSMYGPPPLSSVGLGQGIGQAGQHGRNNMAGQGLGSGHGHLGVPNYPPGPPHFLDQQTSQIWGTSGTILPMGGCYSGSDCNESSSGVKTVLPFQQQLRSSPVPVNTDSISQSDPRYELYCNLCKLFPEDKVRTVMRLHPELDNPNEICAYLIGAK